VIITDIISDNFSSNQNNSTTGGKGQQSKSISANYTGNPIKNKTLTTINNLPSNENNTSSDLSNFPTERNYCVNLYEESLHSDAKNTSNTNISISPANTLNVNKNS